MVPLAKAADESRSREAASKSKVSSFLSPFLYKRLEKQPLLGHTSFYQLILSAILLLTCIQFRWYKNISRETKWPPVTVVTRSQY